MSVVQDPTPSPAQPAGNKADEPTPPREQFIPLRKSELIESLIHSPGVMATQAEQFNRLCRLIDGLIHRQFHHALEELKDAYAPFDPDADTRSMHALSEPQLEESRANLFRRFGWLMERGNFVRLAQEEIDQALAESSHWGLNLAVDFQIFDRLEIYARGDTIGTRIRRRLLNWNRPETVELPIYQRLVVIFRLRPGTKTAKEKNIDTADVFVKLFKDIPQMDLEMLLPGTQVRMSNVDRAKIMLPTMSGLGIAVWKIASMVLFAAAAGLNYAILGLVGGTVGYGARSFFGYINTKQKYQLSLTQSLYFQTLDNNSGAIHRLLDEAEEQENREAVLAYFHLWRQAPEGRTATQLDAEIEQFLLTKTGSHIDFEVPDALAKLKRLNILEPVSENRWRAVPIHRAIEALEAQWRAAME